jgi:D-3-phosphoglycerate dehydrogenase
MPLIDDEKKVLAKYAEVQLASSTDENDLVEEVHSVDVIMTVYANITKRIIDSANRLRGIVRYGIGVDNIDVQAATRRKIPVANVPDYCTGAVADHAFALMLTLNRRILIADDIIRTGEYVGKWTSPPREIRGADLEGKVLGLIGLGRIGTALTKRANGFGMRVRAVDPYVRKELVEELGVELTDLGSVLSSSDFVSIHAPLTPQTRGLIGERELRLMKSTAYLINVARGPLVDENALIRALEEKWIAGAGIDVYEKEPPDPRNPLFTLRNVVLTPHIAWYTDDALRRLEISAVTETIHIIEGKLPQNLVNKEIIEPKTEQSNR